jgi:hypothetical protein
MAHSLWCAAMCLCHTPTPPFTGCLVAAAAATSPAPQLPLQILVDAAEEAARLKQADEEAAMAEAAREGAARAEAAREEAAAAEAAREEAARAEAAREKARAEADREKAARAEAHREEAAAAEAAREKARAEAAREEAAAAEAAREEAARAEAEAARAEAAREKARAEAASEEAAREADLRKAAQAELNDMKALYDQLAVVPLPSPLHLPSHLPPPPCTHHHSTSLHLTASRSWGRSRRISARCTQMCTPPACPASSYPLQSRALPLHLLSPAPGLPLFNLLPASPPRRTP